MELFMAVGVHGAHLTPHGKGGRGVAALTEGVLLRRERVHCTRSNTQMILDVNASMA